MTERSIVGTNDNWQSEVLESKLPVLVDFWAAWCGPCRMVSPVIEKLAGKYEGRVKVVKVNVDDNQELASKFGIMSIPSVLLFKRGSVVASQIGAVPEHVFEEMISRQLSI